MYKKSRFPGKESGFFVGVRLRGFPYGSSRRYHRQHTKHDKENKRYEDERAGHV